MRSGAVINRAFRIISSSQREEFVLHDMFGLPFEEIAPMAGRSPSAATTDR